MHIFYSTELSEGIFTFSDRESIHLSRVLRLNVGSTIRVINDSGTLYECSVTESTPKCSRARIEKEFPGFGKRDYHLHIAIAPTKNNERFEWFTEKCVEFGIDEITPLMCEFSERSRVNHERLERITVAAMKQSIKACPTKINRVTEFDQFIKNDHRGHRFIAFCDDSFQKESLKQLYRAGHDATILIGPEGDFSEKEVKKAVEKGFRTVHLGPSRLRTETAGIAACCTIYLLNQ
ncbi:MAG TPA: 16S rRNA (uracil(1498)-N(3))-methyltransferase [Bacteroidales bacterium]|nr:16S rRNA (uracil(1498)-N(3))-methyltransferase [Bacteroidales bacterium]